MQKDVFYNAKERPLKSLLPILFTFMVLLRLTDGGQCWFLSQAEGSMQEQ